MSGRSRAGDETRALHRRKFLVLASSAVAAGASALFAPRARAQSAAFPTRPITIVVAYAPGSATDILARIFASELSGYLGQNVIVECKPGAGGSIGVTVVARAKNDGYTLGLIAPAPLVINPSLYRNLPYDPVKDFTPLVKLASSSGLLLVPAQSPATSAQDLMRRMKERKKGNSFQFNSTGNGTTQHLQGVLLAKLAGANADHVPYRGVADQLTALATGQVDFGFAVLPSVVGFVKGGRLRALAITSAAPSPLLPDVPSFSSLGLEEFTKTGIWWGVIAPKDMPEAVMQTLNRAFAKALSNPDLQVKLVAAGFEPVAPGSASEFAQFIRDQFAFWGDLVKASGASAD